MDDFIYVDGGFRRLFVRPVGDYVSICYRVAQQTEEGGLILRAVKVGEPFIDVIKIRKQSEPSFSQRQGWHFVDVPTPWGAFLAKKIGEELIQAARLLTEMEAQGVTP